MPQPVYVPDGNEAVIESLEGLYIVPKKPPASIKGVLLNDVVITGTAVRGPKDALVEITDEARFVEVFGARDYGSGGAIMSELWKALLNKQFGRIWCVRAVAAGAATSSGNLTGGATAWTRPVTCAAKAGCTDGHKLNINDGVNPVVVIELDKVPDGVAGGSVLADISGATSAQDVAVIVVAAIKAKIDAGLLNLNAIATPIAGAITLVASVLGTHGNVTLTADASFTLGANTAGTDETKLVLSASSPGKWSDGLITWQTTASSDAIASHFNLVITYLGKVYTYESLDITSGHDNSLTVLTDDPGVLVSISKSASGFPYLTSGTLTGGTDGAIADSDFTAAGRALDVAESQERGVTARFVAGRSNTAIKASLKTRAARTNRGFWLACPDASNTSKAAAITEAATLAVPAGTLLYAFNHTKTLDPETASSVTVEPLAWLASVLSQTDVNINPGDEDAKVYLAGVTDVITKLNRQDLIDLKAGGIAAIVMDDGATFQSGVTADGQEIADVRSVQWLNESIANFLRHSVKKPNTVTRRRMNVAAIDDFLGEQVRDEHVVEAFEVDGATRNTPTSRSHNVEKVLVRGRLISHMNFLVLESEFGTTVVVKAAA